MKKGTRTYELIVVGGGPAGVAAAVHAKTLLSNIILIEKGVVGGKVNEIFPLANYDNASRLGKGRLGLAMEKQLSEGRLAVRKLEVSSIRKKGRLFVIRGQGSSLYSQAVVVATGSSWKKLELEKTADVHYGSFSYRAVSDAHRARGRVVLVIGGGYSGCQVATSLANFAEKVHLVHRGGRLAVDSQLESKMLENDKVEVHLHSTLLETSGEKKLESCLIRGNQEQKKLEVSMVFPCIGTIANSGLVSNVVARTATGAIRVGENFQTNTKGLFAAGDVTGKNNSQISTASTEGQQAAQAAINYLRRN